jgi:hypothetical protein
VEAFFVRERRVDREVLRGSGRLRSIGVGKGSGGDGGEYTGAGVGGGLDEVEVWSAKVQ